MAKKELSQSETWKHVVGYGDFAASRYSVSNLGRVRREDGFIPHSSLDKDGYKRVSIQVGEGHQYKTVKIHRLVCLAFIDNPQNKPCVDHIDSNRQNNNVANLRWATVQENNSTDVVRRYRKEHMEKHNIGFIDGKPIWLGRHHSQETKNKISLQNHGRVRSEEYRERQRIRMIGKRNVKCFKPVSQYTLDGVFLCRWPSVKDAMESIPNAQGGAIYKCATGKYKQAYGYMWRYE